MLARCGPGVRDDVVGCAGCEEFPAAQEEKLSGSFGLVQVGGCEHDGGAVCCGTGDERPEFASTHGIDARRRFIQ